MSLQNQSRTLNDALRELVGVGLHEVEFFEDYLQLRFGGPILTAYTQPWLVVDTNRVLRSETPNYRTSLQTLIGTRVKSAVIREGKELVLDFEDGRALKIPLEDSYYRGPEAVQFVSGDGSFWVV